MSAFPLVTLALGALPTALGALADDDVPLNDPSLCTVCEGDPELMAAGGIESHGGFEFGSSDTAAVDRLLATSDVKWIETEHLEIGFAMGSYRPSYEERKKVRAELERLEEVFPEVKPKSRSLDRWQRAHLYAQRAEDAYRRFQEILQVTDEDFPDGSKPWDLTGEYMGVGPYLGEKGKFELLVLPSEAAHLAFLEDQYGLRVRRTQRWNQIDRDTLSVTIHGEQSGMRNDDQALHGHVVFNLAINFLDGYRHYSYDTPIWLREGLAHFLEREVSPEYNSFDASEGAISEGTTESDWDGEVQDMIRKGDAPRLAELVSLKSYGEMTLEDHFASWSMTTYLIEEHPDAYVAITDAIHGRVDAEGYPDGSNLNDVHRDAFRDHLGMAYREFDAAWSEWALAR